MCFSLVLLYIKISATKTQFCSPRLILQLPFSWEDYKRPEPSGMGLTALSVSHVGGIVSGTLYVRYRMHVECLDKFQE